LTIRVSCLQVYPIQEHTLPTVIITNKEEDYMETTKQRIKKFTVRTDEDVAALLRHNYELHRQKQLVEGQPISSLNQYICRILEMGIEKMEVMTA